jgi:hypothetical protein
MTPKPLLNRVARGSPRAHGRHPGGAFFVGLSSRELRRLAAGPQDLASCARLGASRPDRRVRWAALAPVSTRSTQDGAPRRGTKVLGLPACWNDLSARAVLAARLAGGGSLLLVRNRPRHVVLIAGARANQEALGPRVRLGTALAGGTAREPFAVTVRRRRVFRVRRPRAKRRPHCEPAMCGLSRRGGRAGPQHGRRGAGCVAPHAIDERSRSRPAEQAAGATGDERVSSETRRSRARPARHTAEVAHVPSPARPTRGGRAAPTWSCRALKPVGADLGRCIAAFTARPRRADQAGDATPLPRPT